MRWWFHCVLWVFTPIWTTSNDCEHKNDTLLFQNTIKNTKKLLLGSWGHFAPLNQPSKLIKFSYVTVHYGFFTQLWGSIWRTSNHFTNIQYNGTLKVRLFVCLLVCLFVCLSPFSKKFPNNTKKILWDHKKMFFRKKQFRKFFAPTTPPNCRFLAKSSFFFWKS